MKVTRLIKCSSVAFPTIHQTAHPSQDAVEDTQFPTISYAFAFIRAKTPQLRLIRREHSPNNSDACLFSQDWEAEAGSSLSSRPGWSTARVTGQPRLHRETLSQKQKVKHGGVRLNLALGRWGRENSWNFLASQSSLLSKRQASKSPVRKTKWTFHDE